MRSVPEGDWKKLRAMKDALLQIACERILKKITAIIETRGNESHKAYLNLWNILKKEDKEIAIMFDDLRRSNAIHKLIAWKHYGLLTDEDLKQFSEETQKIINTLLHLNQ